MSVKAMTAAFDVGDRLRLPTNSRLILLRLADWADDFGFCWPSIADLADKSGAHRATVFRVLDRLEEAGLLVRVVSGRGRHRTSLYRVLPGWLPDDPSQSAVDRYNAWVEKRSHGAMLPDSEGPEKVAFRGGKGRSWCDSIR